MKSNECEFRGFHNILSNNMPFFGTYLCNHRNRIQLYGVLFDIRMNLSISTINRLFHKILNYDDNEWSL